MSNVKQVTTLTGQVGAEFTAGQDLSLGARQGLNPCGAIIMFSGVEAPSGYLMCDGSTYDKDTYPALFRVIKFMYGGDAKSLFAVPNLRQRVPLGADATYTLASTGGSNSVSLTEAQMPRHTHGQASHNHSQNPHTHYIYSGPAGGVHPTIQQNGNNGALYGPVQTITATNNPTTAVNYYTGGTHSGQSPGDGSPFSVVQAYVAINFIIKF